MSFTLAGLLHLQPDEHSAVNVTTRSFADQISVYTDNAIALARSLSARNIQFTLLTNDRMLVESISPEIGRFMVVEEIDFTTRVPAGTRFFSAHFKFDAFRHLARAREAYVGLVDLDVLCINPLPACLQHIVQAGLPLAYDITEQVVPAYGHGVILQDLQAIAGMPSEGRWMGGEFLCGPPAFFAELMREVDAIYPSYLSVLKTAHHVGDEAVTSAALERLRRRGVYVGDAGSLGIIGRFWNAPVRHWQQPLQQMAEGFLLHLPADKRFLAGLAKSTVDPTVWRALYIGHARRSWPKRQLIRLKSLVRRWVVPRTQGAGR